MDNIIKELSEIPKIERTFQKTKIKLKKKDANVKMCIYYSGLQCAAPSSYFEICKACPYGYARCFGKILKNIFNKTISLAINILEKDSNVIRRR